jgi:hypothetical protein
VHCQKRLAIFLSSSVSGSESCSESSQTLLRIRTEIAILEGAETEKFYMKFKRTDVVKLLKILKDRMLKIPYN